MTDLPDPARMSPARADKLRAIAAVFGDAVAARIGATVAPDPAETVDPDRLAWQTNRLIRHLRGRIEGPDTQPPRPAARSTSLSDAPSSPLYGPVPDAASGSASGPGTGAPRRVGTRNLALLAAGEDLAAEHPAVIAHILRCEAQEVRVSVLRALPGHVSRAVIQRLRRTERGTEG